MSIEEFLKRHPKPWHEGGFRCSESDTADHSAICDINGTPIDPWQLLYYIDDLETALDKGRPGKPTEVPFGEFPTMNAMSPCGTTCNTKKITFDMYNKARCHRCGRNRPFYDRKS